jgi:hypothetical protein
MLGREQEHPHHVALGALVELLGALPVDVEQEILPALELLADVRLGRAVAVPEDSCVLEEGIVRDELVELGLIDKVVVAALDLARPHRPRGHRHRQLHSLALLGEQAASDGRLPGARGRGQDEHQPAALERVVIGHVC